MKRKGIILVAYIILTYIIHNSVVFAGVNLPWSTTYDCDEWIYDGNDPSCDGLAKGLSGEWYDGPCGYEQITSRANNPDGGGGKGQLHPVCDAGNVWPSSSGGGTVITFNSAQPELWIRFYIKYEEGFKFENNSASHKILFIRDEQSITQPIPKFQYGDSFGLFTQGPGISGAYRVNGTGWATTMGGATGDGKWHYIEIHLKTDTNKTDGIFEFWIDNRPVERFNNVNYDTKRWRSITIASNFHGVTEGPWNVFYDDIAISNTGKIGPLDEHAQQPTDTEVPTVQITSPQEGTTVSGTSTIIAAAQDNIGIDRVQFLLDGVNIGNATQQTPYQLILDTTNIDAGSHSITATTWDASGNQATSGTVNIIVDNSSAPEQPTAPTLLFTEDFEDANFASRSWYDNINLNLSTTEHVEGSSSSLEFRFLQGASSPTSGAAIRKKIDESEEVYISYYVKYSSNWEGSNVSTHPHEFYLLTNLNGDWDSLAYTHFTFYVEQNEGVPVMGIQDSQNINTSQVGNNLTTITENRGVAGCNGDSDGYGNGDCYSIGNGNYKNGKLWRAGGVYFRDTFGEYYKNDWHHVEAYIKLNTISNGIAAKDAQLKYWFDGELVMNLEDVVLRTGQHPNMKFNQFVIAPYMGSSPVDQTLWIDNLSVATSPPDSITPPPSSNEPPDPPTNLEIIRIITNN